MLPRTHSHRGLHLGSYYQPRVLNIYVKVRAAIYYVVVGMNEYICVG